MKVANIYLFKINDRDTRKTCEICSKLTIKTTERLHYCELRTYFTLSFSAPIVDFELINVYWEHINTCKYQNKNLNLDNYLVTIRY